MSMPIVTRTQAENYAKENDIFLMEAKKILMDQEKIRIRTKPGFRIKTDEDGFYVGTEPVSNPH